MKFTLSIAMNPLDQLTELQTPDGSHWHYSYDPFGRRIARRSGAQGYAAQWEGDRQIAEAPIAADGLLPFRSLLWSPDRRLVASGTGQCLFRRAPAGA